MRKELTVEQFISRAVVVFMVMGGLTGLVVGLTNQPLWVTIAAPIIVYVPMLVVALRKYRQLCDAQYGSPSSPEPDELSE